MKDYAELTQSSGHGLLHEGHAGGLRGGIHAGAQQQHSGSGADHDGVDEYGQNLDQSLLGGVGHAGGTGGAGGGADAGLV